jgi:hypothetical protein
LFRVLTSLRKLTRVCFGIFLLEIGEFDPNFRRETTAEGQTAVLLKKSDPSYIRTSMCCGLHRWRRRCVVDEKRFFLLEHKVDAGSRKASFFPGQVQYACNWYDGFAHGV